MKRLGAQLLRELAAETGEEQEIEDVKEEAQENEEEEDYEEYPDEPGSPVSGEEDEIAGGYVSSDEEEQSMLRQSRLELLFGGL